MSQFIEIAPTKFNDSPSTIRAAIRSSTDLPVPGYENIFCDESVILSHLSRRRAGQSQTPRWRDPRGLFGYSKDSEYKDLYAYFDYGDKTSPVNELATKALAMYGLGGAMGEPNWKCIRGTVILERLEPDTNFCPGLTYNPNITMEEIYQTLIFFRDSKYSAREIATRRDSVRMMRGMGMRGAREGFGFGFGSINGQSFGGFGSGSGGAKAFMDLINSSQSSSSLQTHYLGPTGETRKKKQVDMDQDKCDHCGKRQALIGRKLKKCTVCQVTFYCGKECQKAAWKKHKKICRTLSQS